MSIDTSNDVIKHKEWEGIRNVEQFITSNFLIELSILI